jgi:4-hydroxythreonine-4-phosphate dehydrogenase
MTNLPLLTMGDPAGVGPELVCRLAQMLGPAQVAVVGVPSILQRVAAQLGLPLPGTIEAIPTDSAALSESESESESELQPGKFTARTGSIAWQSIETGIQLVQAEQYASLVTNPVNKEALVAAGCPFPGHTELLGARCGERPTAMWMHGQEALPPAVDDPTAAKVAALRPPDLNVVLTTCHIPLAQVPTLLTTERVIDVATWLAQALHRLLDRPPRLAMLGLNPHAGEQGLLGPEENEIIAPAIAQLRQRGYHVSDPLPPDTAFLPHLRQEFDGYIAHYHDQGLIPFKTLCFATGVNSTLNLPIIRTSVDHGTAGDIAWQGIAETSSLEAAWQLAQRLGISASSASASAD